MNTLAVSATDGTVVRHERYASKRAGEKFMSSIFAIHSGSFFGLAGVIIYMLASLTMPLFTVTGWMMYLGRRQRKKRAALAERSDPAAASTI
jgi:sulfite reductase (NADPH) flavoprotein alpha-component